MKRILTFGASNSSTSINVALVNHAISHLQDCEIDMLDMNDYEMPLFGVDREKNEGIPAKAKEFKEHIHQCDGIIISFAEHNGSYSAVFKNLLDWASRVEKSMWLDKVMFLMATSPGARGGISVLNAAAERFKWIQGDVVAKFSLPSFDKNFDPEKGILDDELKTLFENEMDRFKAAL